MNRLQGYLCIMILCAFLGEKSEALAASKAHENMIVKSPAFESDDDFPVKYTCSGGDINPPLEISNLPAKTKSLALTVHTPDAPEGTWVHWVVFNIPPSSTRIVENSIPGKQALNDFGKFNYAGPCPVDDKEHVYIFRVYALNSIIDAMEGITMIDLEKIIKNKTLAKAELKTHFRKAIW